MTRAAPIRLDPPRSRQGAAKLTSAGPRFVVTRAGWLFLAVCMLIGLAAVKSQAPLLYLVFGAMIAALQASAMMGMAMLRALEIRRKAPARAWQRQVVPIAYFLRNLRRRSSLGLTIREQPGRTGRGGKAPSSAAPGPRLQLANGYCTHLPALAVFRAGARLAAGARGRFHLGPLRVSTLFPFGLVEARREFRQDAGLIVWPARGRLRKQLLPRGAVETSSAAPSRGAGGQDEFFGLREYRPDDNPRWIHWRRSAGKLTPVVREMARPLPEILYILLDTQVEAQGIQAPSRGHPALAQDNETTGETPSPLAGADPRLERCLRFAATLIDEALGHGYQVGLALAYRSGPAAFGASASAAHRTALLDALADVDANIEHGLERTLAALRPGQLRLAQVVLVTLADSPPPAVNLRGLRSACRHLQVFPESRLDRVFEDAVGPTETGATQNRLEQADGEMPNDP